MGCGISSLTVSDEKLENAIRVIHRYFQTKNADKIHESLVSFVCLFKRKPYTRKTRTFPNVCVVHNCGGIELLVDIVCEYLHDEPIYSRAMQSLSYVCTLKNCYGPIKRAIDYGIIPLIARALHEHFASFYSVRFSFAFLISCCTNNLSRSVNSSECIEAVMHAFRHNTDCMLTMVHFCMFLQAFTDRNDYHKTIMRDAGAIYALYHIAVMCGTYSYAARNVCIAVGNMCKNNLDNIQEISKSGMVYMIFEMLKANNWDHELCMCACYALKHMCVIVHNLQYSFFEYNVITIAVISNDNNHVMRILTNYKNLESCQKMNALIQKLQSV